MRIRVKVSQSWLTLCNPMDYTVHATLQARILEWVVFPFSRGSSQPRDWTQDSRIAGRFFTSWATREAQEYWSGYLIPSPADLPDPEIELGSSALQKDSLPMELWGKGAAGHKATLVTTPERPQQHRRDGNFVFIFLRSQMQGLLPQFYLQHLVFWCLQICFISEMRSLTNWLCWTSSFSESARLCRPTSSSVFRFCHFFSSSLFRISLRF